jgi:hypothetical protein
MVPIRGFTRKSSSVEEAEGADVERGLKPAFGCRRGTRAEARDYIGSSLDNIVGRYSDTVGWMCIARWTTV